MRGSTLPLLVLGALALSGCAASIAASALGAAIQHARKPAHPGVDLGPAALEACRARAAQHGAVHIIDVERRAPGKIVVWGTAGEGSGRRSFECRYDGKISGFTLREIAQRP